MGWFDENAPPQQDWFSQNAPADVPTLEPQVVSPPSFVDRIKELAQTPSPEWMRPAEEWARTPLLHQMSREEATKSLGYDPGPLPEEYLPEGKAKEVVGGLREAAGGFVQSLSSPAMLAITLASGGSGAAGRVAAGGFAAQMASQTPELWQQFNEAETLRDKTRIAAEAVATIGGAALGARHAIKGGIGIPSRAGPEAPPAEVPLAETIKAQPPEVPLAERITQPRVEPAPQEPLAPVTSVEAPIIDPVRRAELEAEKAAILGKNRPSIAIGQRLHPTTEARLAAIDQELGQPPTEPLAPVTAVTKDHVASLLEKYQTPDDKSRLQFLHDKWDEPYMDNFKANLDKTLTEVKAKMGDVPFNERDLQRRLLTSDALMEANPEGVYPVPVYVAAEGDLNTVGLLVDKKGKFEMFEGNDEATPKTLDLVDKLLGNEGKTVRVYTSQPAEVVQQIKAGNIPEGIFVSPNRAHAAGYWGEGRELTSFEMPLNRVAQHSEVDWQVRPEPSPGAASPEAAPSSAEATAGMPAIPPEDVRYAGGEPPALEVQPGAPEPHVTSTKKAVVTEEREARGLEPAVQSARRDFGSVWDEAAAEAGNDPTIGVRLVDELGTNPRALTDKENAHLLRRQIEVQNEHDAAIRNVNERPGDVTAEARLDRVRDDLQTVYEATEVAGRETGRGLNARKMLAANDFSLAKMEAETRAVVNKGKPLSEKQVAEVKALHERIATAEAKVAGYEARDAFNEALKQAQTEARKTGGGLQGFLDQQAARARERIVARRGKLYADPIGVTQAAHLVDEAIIGASHIARGVTKFADWSSAMIREFGENIKPFLKDLYARSKELASQTAKGKLTPEERETRALAGEKKAIITRTEQLRAKLAAQEFEKPVRKPPRMDKEKANLLFEYQKAKEAYHHGLIQAKLRERSVPHKILGGAGEALNLTRALMTSFDLSAVLRQGGFIAMGHPFRAIKAFPDMFRALASERGRFQVNEQIRNRANAQSGLYKQAGLYLADERPGTSLSKMEEVYASRLAGKIPGIAASERAYTTFLNRLRADSFDAMTASLAKGGKPTLEEARAIGNFVNVATGRGDMGKYAAAANALSKMFFAPRYVLSRFQTLAGQPLYKGTGRTRAMIAGEYAKMLTGLGTLYTLGMALEPDSVELDPRSTDFGKLKFGNTRVDPLFGMQQVGVFLARELSGQQKNAAGKIEPIRGDVKYGRPTGYDIAARFVRSKMAPVPGTIADLIAGKDYRGQPITPTSAALNAVTPIGVNDIYKVMIDQGVPKGVAFGLLSILGMNIQTYDARRREPHQRGP